MPTVGRRPRKCPIIDGYGNNLKPLSSYPPYMKLINYIIISVSSLVIGSCAQTENNQAEVINLTGSPVQMPSSYLGGFDLLFSGDSLFLQCSYSDTLFRIARLKGDSLSILDAFVGKGMGPNEMTNGSIARKNDGDLIVIDSSIGRIHNIYDIPVNSLHESSGWTKYPIDTISIINASFVSLNDSCIMLASAPSNSIRSIFTKLNYKNQTWEPIEFWPDDGFVGPPFQKMFIYMANSVLRTNGKGKYFYLSGFGKYAFIFTVSNGKVVIDKYLYNEPMKYTASSESLDPKFRTPPEVLRASVNSKHIYIFKYSKKEDGSLSDDYIDTAYGDEVEVYDWNGKLIRKYNLDRGGYYVNVNGDDTDMYLCSKNPDTNEYHWIHYNLKE